MQKRLGREPLINADVMTSMILILSRGFPRCSQQEFLGYLSHHPWFLLLFIMQQDFWGLFALFKLSYLCLMWKRLGKCGSGDLCDPYPFRRFPMVLLLIEGSLVLVILNTSFKVGGMLKTLQESFQEVSLCCLQRWAQPIYLSMII